MVLEVTGLTKTYKDFWGRPTKTAVDNLSFNVEEGQVVGIIGPNGAGKTTTIKMLLGLLRPTKGQIRIFGGLPSDLEVKRRLGFLPEESYLYKFLTPRETLHFFGSLFSLDKKILKERTESLIDRVGLRHAADKPVKEFSKGMTRRLGLAQALINEPELLLLDEPTSGLDPIGTSEVKDLIRDLKSQGKSVLVCSHLLADMESVCDKLVMLVNGKLKLYDNVDNLLVKQEKMTLTFSTAQGVEEASLIATLKEKGAQDIQSGHPRKSLEQLFLEMVKDNH